MIYSCSNLTSFSVVEGKSVNSSGLFLLYFTASVVASVAQKPLVCSDLKAAICFESGKEGKGGSFATTNLPVHMGPNKIGNTGD